MARGRKPQIDHDKCLEFYKRGYTDKDIAAMFGVAYQAVQHWRRKNHLPIRSSLPSMEIWDRDKLRPPRPLYFACEDLDLTWYAEEVRQVIDWYNSGIDIPEMAVRLRRMDEEVGILIIDLTLKGKIEPRRAC